MCINPSTPTLTASHPIPAYSIVVVTPNQNFKLKPSSAAGITSDLQEFIVGVTDSQATSVGQAVTLQCGEVMRLTAANTIAPGDLLESDSNGRALYNPPPYSNLNRHKVFQALESATVGQTFLAARIINQVKFSGFVPYQLT